MMDKNKQKDEENKAKSSNVTLERLAGLPFKSASALKEAQEEVRLRVWRRLEEARALEDMVRREEYQFWKDEFRAGFACAYGDEAEILIRVYADDERGIKVTLNRNKAIMDSETFIGTLVRSLADSFAMTYYRAKGILPASELGHDERGHVSKRA